MEAAVLKTTLDGFGNISLLEGVDVLGDDDIFGDATELAGALATANVNPPVPMLPSVENGLVVGAKPVKGLLAGLVASAVASGAPPMTGGAPLGASHNIHTSSLGSF